MKKEQQQRRPDHYVDNKEFLEHMINFKDATAKAREKGKPDPQIPDELGVVFMKIATHLSFKSNFINYAFREDMISDGIENCIQYIQNFDPEKSRNPFAYFTQIIYYAFLRRIQKEKKQLYVKYKSLENSQVMSELIVNDPLGPDNTSGVSSIGFAKLYDNMSEFVYTFEDAIQKKKDIKNKQRTIVKKKRKNKNNILDKATNLSKDEI